MHGESKSAGGRDASQDEPSAPGPSTGKFTLSLGTANRKHPSASQNHSAAKRPRTALLGGSVEDTSDSHKHEAISAFGGASLGSETVPKAPERNPRVIRSIPNRNWREEAQSKRQTQVDFTSNNDGGAAPQKNGSTNNAAESSTDFDHGVGPKYGLNVVNGDSRGPHASADADRTHNPVHTESDTNGANEESSKPLTADEEALAALLGHQRHSDDAVIAPAPPTEYEVFRDSYDSAPRDCTLEEYEATPIEGYGAAILRGYLKQGQTLDDHIQNRSGNKKQTGDVPERRPGLLGLGAKESGLGVELGAWGRQAGKGAMKGSVTSDITYNPLARRNKKTGELIGENDQGERQELRGDSRAGSEVGTSRDGSLVSRGDDGGRVKKLESTSGRGVPDSNKHTSSKEQQFRSRRGDGEDRQRYRRSETSPHNKKQSSSLDVEKEPAGIGLDRGWKGEKSQAYRDHGHGRSGRRDDRRRDDGRQSHRRRRDYSRDRITDDIRSGSRVNLR